MISVTEALVGFDVLDPGFEKSWEAFEQAARQAGESMREDHVVRRVIEQVRATLLREWHDANSVEERERIHGQVRGLTEVQQVLTEIPKSFERAKQVMEDQEQYDADFDTLS